MTASTPRLELTREALVTRVRQLAAGSGHIMALEPFARGMADAITGLSIEQCIAGRHDGRVVTMACAFELVYGERLTLR